MTDTPSTSSGLRVLEVAMEMAFPSDILDKIATRFGAGPAREAAMSTSVGGIGPLLKERIIAQADLGLNVVGVSLLYDTVWFQGWHSWNHLYIRREQVGEHIRSVLDQTGLTLDLTLFDNTRVNVNVWRAPYGKAHVYFLDCPEITNVVYPCQEDAPPSTTDPNRWADIQRLKQSWVVGRGALALAKALNFQPQMVVLSETPTLFVHPRLVKDDFKNDPFFSNTRCAFNDHTPLEYAHPIWAKETLDLVKLDPAVYAPFLTKSNPQDPGQADITRLLVATSDGVFGVAKKHGQVMRAMPSLKEYGTHIQAITNGVHEDIWRHGLFHSPEKLSDGELISAKEKLKDALLLWLWRRASLWPVWLKAARGKALLLWTRRITSYKRLDMLHTLLNDPRGRQRFLNTDIVLVVGGRVYQRDNVSEKMVYNLVTLLNRDNEVGDRVVFLDNFNVWEAPRLFQGADGAIMLANDGREASATGFMKSQMNGGLVIANSDGAVPEFVYFKGQEPEGKKANGFGVSYTAGGEPDSESFLKALEDFSRVFKDPVERASMMRAALAVTPEVSVQRTAQEMVTFYNTLTHPS